ncbi:hypothetical protein QUB70_32965, partial [Microcoleus sp. A003_D6]|uniref:hypothetical protein n=1 Tax=Microcoleus sp. A003_D6 TaxID=3055266 RepID=UPI002FCF4EAE
NITGKGGVPANPNDALSSDSAQFNWVEPSAAKNSATDGITDRLSVGNTVNSREILPAQGWVMNQGGEVTLVGYNPGAGASARVPQPTGACVPR